MTSGMSSSQSSKKRTLGCLCEAPNYIHWQMNQLSNGPAGLKSKIGKENESTEGGQHVECKESEGLLIA